MSINSSASFLTHSRLDRDNTREEAVYMQQKAHIFSLSLSYCTLDPDWCISDGCFLFACPNI